MANVNITQSVIVDPTFHSNKRTEFKLYGKGRVFDANLRLVDFGVSSATNDEGNTAFSLSGGLNSIIKNIYLYFNDVLVDQVKDASQYLSIQNLGKPNYTVFRNFNNKLVRSNLILNRELDDDTMLELDEPSTALVGMLRLSDVFPVLSVMNSIDPTTKSTMPLVDISEIRVSIEYESSVNKIFSAPVPDAFTISQPAIIYTEYFNYENPNSNLALRFNAIENERLILSPTNNRQSIQVRAFDKKMVSNLLFQNIPNNQADDSLCYQYSTSLTNEKVNLLVNGRSFLNFQGADNEAKKLMWTTDSSGLGYHFSPLGSAFRVGEVNDEQFTQYGDSLLNLQSKLSFLCLNINTKIDRIDYEVSFDGQGGDPITVYVYGSVVKYLMRKGDVFMTQYAQPAKSM